MSKSFEDLVMELDWREGHGGGERSQDWDIEGNSTPAPVPGRIKGYFLGDVFLEID